MSSSINSLCCIQGERLNYFRIANCIVLTRLGAHNLCCLLRIINCSDGSCFGCFSLRCDEMTDLTLHRSIIKFLPANNITISILWIYHINYDASVRKLFNVANEVLGFLSQRGNRKSKLRTIFPLSILLQPGKN